MAPDGSDDRLIARARALLEASRSLALHRTIGELCSVLAEHLHRVVPFDYLALVLYNPDDQLLELSVLEPESMPGPPRVQVPPTDDGPAATVWRTQQSTVISIPDGGTLHPTLEHIRKYGRRVTCWLPLTTVHGRLGVLSFGSSLANTYGTGAQRFMEQVAAHIAVAVDNSLNYDRAERLNRELLVERERLRLLLDVSKLLVGTRDLPAVLTAASDALRQAVPHDRAGLRVRDGETGRIRAQLSYDLARGVVRERIEDGTLVDASEPPLVARSGETMFSLPLVTTGGHPVGSLALAWSGGRALTASDREILAHVAPEIAIAATNAVSFDELNQENHRLADEKSYLEAEARERDKFGDIIGGSAALRQALSAIESVASTDATVLLLGETGTGKELAARAIHGMSPRAQRAFIRVNAAAIPSGLLESELFGHEKGAFTGAISSRAGRLELAEHGTLFLDEVGDLPLELQPKLLRVLQEREYERLGSNRTRKADVRLIAATNRDLESMVAAGAFREDLYYRLSVFPIRLPPLRERTQDIPALVRYFAAQCAKRLNRRPSEIPDDVMQALEQWHWPGNIRELENVIERAVIISQDGRLRLSSHDLQIGSRRPHKPKASETLKDVERKRIIAALRESGGVIAGPNGAASRLGVKRTTLQSMMRRLGIQRPSY